MDTWEQRFRAPVAFLPTWSPEAPDRVVYASNESGIWQVHAWDLATGDRRQVTDHPVGVLDGMPTRDGAGVVWFQDDSGDEAGRWLVQPFHGGETDAFLEGVPDGWSGGLAQAQGIVAAAVSDRDGFAVYVSLDGGPAREIHRSQESVYLGAEGGGLGGALSADGSLLCLEHSEHGDLIHPALRVVDPRSGETVGELRDEGMSLHAKCWSPVAGVQRLAFEHELEGDERPGIWDLATGERTNLAPDLEGAVTVTDWWPDGSALLLQNSFEGRISPVPLRPRNGRARARADASRASCRALGCDRTGASGSRTSRATASGSSSTTRERSCSTPEDGLAPAGRPYESWHFENPHGQTRARLRT